MRTKLRLALALPALGFLALAGIQVSSSVTTVTSLDRFARELSLGYVTGDLVHALQRERAHTAGALALDPESEQQILVNGQLIDDQRAVDLLAAQLDEAVRPLRSDRQLARRYAAARTDLDGLQRVRDGSRGGLLGDRAAFDQYTDMITDLAAILPTDFDLHADPALARTVRSIAEVMRVKELNDQMRARLYAASLAGKSSRDDYESLADLRARQSAAIDQFRSDAGPADIARYDRIVGGDVAITAARLQVAAIDRFRGVGDGVSADEWWQASTAQLEQLRAADRALLDSARAGTASLRRTTWVAAVRSSAAIAAVLLVALLLSWAVGRAISRSLRALRTQALEVANITLPAAIDQIRTGVGRRAVVPESAVTSNDDFGEVSDAFTAVHQRAVNLAAEQATMRHNVNAMFVNLARRSQTLVERQLQLLDHLESAETDPDQLDNLFKLDHLAARMRRNDDNLLVLAGSETTRRRTQPVALPAVALAAMAEIDQYARIRHDITDGLYLVGHAVSDVVHLLAELLENATMFSPPDTTVMLTGWPSPDGSGATIGIQDHGIGMTPTGLREANESVSRPIAIDVAASERMGLIVVGHLAARQGIKVQLRASTSGVLAYVTLPHRLLTDSATGPAEAPPGAGGDTGPADGSIATTSLIRRSMTALVPDRGRADDTSTDRSGPERTPQDRSGSNRVPGVPAASLPTASEPTVSLPTLSPVNAPTATAATSAEATDPPAAPPPPRRPARAQAVLDAAAQDDSTTPQGGDYSRWWTRGGQGAAIQPDTQSTPQPWSTAPRPPIDAGTSTAGLPIRMPMAQLPPMPRVTPKIDSAPAEAPDPTEVGSLLSRFYSGVQRATVDEGASTTPGGD